MAKPNMNDLLKKRMASTKQASELAASDEAYERIFRETPPVSPVTVRELPLDLLDPFTTADIGFKPYLSSKLQAFAEQLQAEGLLVKIIVRRKVDGRYEILAGHNRAAAARLAGWECIAAEIVEADDARAIVIATSTNLIQRQQLSIVERGKAYKALLTAKNRQGYRSDLSPLTTSGENQPKLNGDAGAETSGENQLKLNDDRETKTSGENQPKYSARALVAEFFGVTEYEIRKLVKLTNLVPELLNELEDNTKLLNLAAADMIADYDWASQKVFAEICTEYGRPLNKAYLSHIAQKCPPPTAGRQEIFAAYREAQQAEEKRRLAPPKNITFTRKHFEPYLSKFKDDAELERLFLEFLRQRVG